MFSVLRRNFGTAGLVVSVIALITALAGGAIAASGGSEGKATASAKGKRGPTGPRGPKGATGPAGAVGSAGAQGAAGANGKDGAPGTSGKDGQSVEAVEFGPTEEPEGDPCAGRGGVELISASPEPTFACNGEEGSPWTAGGVLPTGATETGTWLVSEAQYLGISFPIPLAASIGETKVKFIAKEATPEAECDNGAGEAASAANPEADPGYLCIFVAQGEGPLATISASGPGAGKTGAVLFWASKQAASFGTFAVSAP